MEATSTDQKTFQLVDNGKQVGELIYKGFFSFSAEMKLGTSDVYEIKSVGLFGTTLTVTKAGLDIANLQMNWRGQIVIAFQDGQEFVLKAMGTFYNKFIIENKEQEKLVLYDPTFDWRKWHYNYTITYEEKPQDVLLILLGVYASNYFIATMSGMA
ncbi:hypothetical protein [Fibrivirga algicola]|uniref:Uncharacterized protein n=1 Tax=Fibrivirga algicola TaxID=2950420 RepID=A0ABX0QBL7_9BACT|nr:hypothetical protein [Fibrivirga algicola]ARK09306.1 hypothetical protein A6C57_02610 [Fibrella sp. ES10-3-2-2]NID08571.1 hypothetical protein [Fibrivirga algicola]